MKAANETYTLIGRESPSILWKKTLLLPFTNFLFSMFAFALLLPSSLSPSLAVSSEFPNTLRVKTLPNDKLNLEFYSTFIIVLPSTYSILWVMRESIKQLSGHCMSFSLNLHSNAICLGYRLYL